MSTSTETDEGRPASRSGAPATAPAGRGAVLPLFVDGWRQRVRGVVGWAMGFAVVILIYLPLFPTYGDSGIDLQEQVDALPSDLAAALNFSDIGDGAGYTQATVFGLMGTLLIVVFATLAGSRTAGDEESGLLDLYLARAVSRRRLHLERWLHLLSEVAVLTGLVGLLVLAVSGPSELGLSVVEVTGATLGLLGLGLLVGTAALAAGAATGRKSVALAVGTLVGAGSYVANAVAGIADVGWLRDASPFDWAFGADPLQTGVDGPGLALLLGSTVLLVVLGLLRFDRRDVQV